MITILKRTLLTILLASTIIPAVAQETVAPLKRNTIFIELLGNGFSYSFNYDRILMDREKWKLAGRVGGRYNNSFDERRKERIAVPVEVSYLKGRKNHFLELGLGVTPGYEARMFKRYWDSGDPRFIQDAHLRIVGRVGYRYQLRDGGMFYKVGFTPMAWGTYDLDKEEPKWDWIEVYNIPAFPWIGLAAGYTF